MSLSKTGMDFERKFSNMISKHTHCASADATQLRRPSPQQALTSSSLHPCRPLAQDVEGEHGLGLCKQTNGQHQALAIPHGLPTCNAGFLGSLRLCSRVYGGAIIWTKGTPFISCSYPFKLVLILLIKQVTYELCLYRQC
jgi:hypothetical protein